MVKRDKKLKKAIESYKEEIEKHFKKLDKDILENDEITARYHIKEIDKSLIAGVEKRMIFLSKNSKETYENKKLIDKYRKKLEEYKRKLSKVSPHGCSNYKVNPQGLNT